MSNTFVYIDTETNGLSPDRNEIVEVCAIKFDENGNYIDKFYQLCKPASGKIPEKVSKINGITIDMVNDKPNYLKDGVRDKLADFIKDDVLIGHNIDNFDIHFLKLVPKKSEDTLVMARHKFPKMKNDLASVCKRMGVKFNIDEAHSAEYDVKKGIELYCRLKGFQTSSQLTLFSNNDFNPTQAYSFSRIKLYHTCPYKWYKQYIEKVKEPGYPHFVIGRVCHRVAEFSAIWSYKESFAIKFDEYLKKKGNIVNPELRDSLIKELKNYNNKEEVTKKDVGRYFYEYPTKISEYTSYKSNGELLNEIESNIEVDELLLPNMPELDTYRGFIEKAYNEEKVNDPEIKKECEYILNNFYKRKDFSLSIGKLALAERKLSFDKDWNIIKNWNDSNIFFRGILDMIEYYGDYIVITDYKTSRKMLTEEELLQEPQFKIYTLLLYYFLPKDSINRIFWKIDYMRFNKIVEVEVPDYKIVIKEAKQWIKESVIEIEKKLINGIDAFKPDRNQYCSQCFLALENKCPLFNRKDINNIDNPEDFVVTSVDDCMNAWKRIEVNKCEIKNLTKKCKEFILSTDNKITVDKKAILNFWTENVEKYDSYKLLQILINKGIEIKNILRFFNITKSEFHKMIFKLGLEFTEDERKEFIKINKRTVFDANTEEEVKNKGYLNI